jgi:large subunit ribosomal protein L28
MNSNLNLQVRHRSNRSRRGLYDGKDIRSGNNVSFSMKATKRKFKPNVLIKRVYSEILDDMVKFHLTASTLRSIDKAGGLDNYLMNKDDITEGEGYDTKQKIKKRLKNQARMDRKATEAQFQPQAHAQETPLAANAEA